MAVLPGPKGWMPAAAVAVGALLALCTVEEGRTRPLRPRFAAAAASLLLCAFLAPAVEALLVGRNSSAAVWMAQYLLALQVLLFFTRPRGSMLFVLGGANLFILLVSGLLDGGPSLLGRLAFYLVSLVLALGAHTVWRERLRFEARQAERRAAGGRHAYRQAGAETRPSLSARASWQSAQLAILSVLSGLCGGLLLFFAWPRFNEETLFWMRDLIPALRPDDKTTGDTDPPGTGLKTGLSLTESVDLNDLAPIEKDARLAVKVEFSRPPREWVGREGRVFLRQQALHTCLRGRWTKPRGERRLTGTGAVSLEGEEQHLGPAGEVIEQKAELFLERNRRYLVLTPLRKLLVPAARLDEEGNVLAVEGGNLEPLTEESRYAAVSRRPVRPEDLPPQAVPVSLDPRYLRWEQALAQPANRARVEELARQVTEGSRDALERVLRLRDYLRDSGRYSYTTRLDQVPKQGDPLADFLLGENRAERQGHCGYFASALVVLCRAARLPARLATGFAWDARADEAGTRQVLFLCSDAHAWAEVYFKDYGWVAFDATPGVVQTAAPPPAVPAVSPKPPATRDWAEASLRRVIDYDAPRQQALYSQVGAAVQTAGETCGRFLTRIGPGAVWLLAALALVVGLLRWRRRSLRRKESLAVLPARARATVLFYQECLRLLAKRGFARRRAQTPREFSEFVIRRGGVPFAPLATITEVFERARYAREDIGASELARVAQALRELRPAPAAESPPAEPPPSRPGEGR